MDMQADEGLGEEERVARRRETRSRIARDYRIESEYVQIPKLARIVGFAPSTLYGYIRTGSFFLPYRLLNSTVVVSLDDLAAWLCSSDGVVPPRAEAPRPERRGALRPSESRADVDETFFRTGARPRAGR